MGRKIAIPIRYDERISLEPFMSEGSYGPTYTLYGVISHAGSGPNSGHYYAHVKGANGKWYEMNDDCVTPQSGAPTSLKNAYILFYILEKGQTLEAALSSRPATPVRPPPPTSKIAAMKKKRKTPDSTTEDGRPSSAKMPKFIGPLLPSSQITSPKTPAKDAPKADPQSEALKKKITAAQSQSGKAALQSLAAYGDEDDDDDVGEKVTEERGTSAESSTVKSSFAAPASSAPAAPSQPPVQSPTTSGIPPNSFYGTATPKSNDRKRKTPDGEEDSASYKAWARTPITPSSSSKGRRHSAGPRISAGNPFSKLKGGNNLHAARNSSFSSPGPGHRRPGHGHKRRMIM